MGRAHILCLLLFLSWESSLSASRVSTGVAGTPESEYYGIRLKVGIVALLKEYFYLWFSESY